MTLPRAVKCLTLVLGVLTATGCQSAQTTAAHKIADALPREIGPAAHYEVQVEGESFALARGRARCVHIAGEQVQVAPDATLDITARDISLDPGTRRVSSVGEADFTGTVGQQNLDRYLAARHPGLSGLAVRLRTHDARAEVPVSLGDLHTQVAVSGILAPDKAHSNRLDFVAGAASIGALPIPARLVNLALREVNPIFDLSNIKVPVTLARADIEDKQVILQGTADISHFQQ